MSKEQIEQLEKLIEFAKFGFRGTLSAGISGMVLVLLLAILDAFTGFDITSEALVLITLIVALGTVAFGYFSLRKAPTIDFRMKDGEVIATVTEAKK
ncbi:MAG: hypothetical protein GKR95_20515 [Gammaproteobacteria bacterium]|nr:hypothetical protein [Gammaproteobacteria bacterium]